MTTVEDAANRRQHRLVVGLAVGILPATLLCVLAWKTAQIRREQAAVVALIKRGASLYRCNFDDRVSIDAYLWNFCGRGDGPVRTVHFGEAEVDEAVWEELKRLPYLTGLHLWDASFSDGDLQHLEQHPNITWLELRGTNITDAGLKHVAALTGLTALILDDTAISDSGLKELKGLKELSLLSLAGTQVTDAGFDDPGWLPPVNSLQLNRTRITDLTIEHVMKFPDLNDLDVSDTSVSDAGVACLVDGLWSLNLARTGITDAGLIHLGTLANVRRLNLSGTKITDAGLPRLGGLRELDSLDVSKTRITDAGLKGLRGLKELEHLTMHDTAVTDVGAAVLREALPDLHIECAHIPDDLPPKMHASYLHGELMAMGPQERPRPPTVRDIFEDDNVAALASAAATGKRDEIARLVASGTDVNAAGKGGITPLLWALFAQSKEGYRELLLLKANPNARPPDGQSVVNFVAQITDDREWLSLALQHGGDPNLVIDDGCGASPYTPIFNAICQRNAKGASLLIEAGADVDYRNGAGDTPLSLAVDVAAYDIVLDLLETGADYESTNSEGQKILDTIAQSANDLQVTCNPVRKSAYRKVVEWLEQRPAKPPEPKSQQ